MQQTNSNQSKFIQNYIKNVQIFHRCVLLKGYLLFNRNIWFYFLELNGMAVQSCLGASAGASPRIFEWGGGRIVGRVANLPQNTLKIGKNTGFSPLHSRIWGGGVERPGLQNCGGQDPSPDPPVGDAPVHQHVCCYNWISAQLT